MDCLLANYASSDEDQEEEHEQSEKENPPASNFTGNSPPYASKHSDIPKSFSLPPPKFSSSLFSSLPPPKSYPPSASQAPTSLSSSKPYNQQPDDDDDDEEEDEQRKPQRLGDAKLPSKASSPIKPSNVFSSLSEPKSSSSSSSSIFSSLPLPKTLNADSFSLGNLSSTPAPIPKKVVQLKLPINPFLMKSSRIDDDEEEEEEEEREGERKKSAGSSTQAPSVKSFLSSIPAPKNSSTLGSLPSAAGTGRRSILEDVPSLNSKDVNTETEVGVNSNVGNNDGQWVDGSSSASLGAAGGYAEYTVSGNGDASGWVSSSTNHETYDTYAAFENYGYYGQYDSNWGDGSTAMMPSQTLGMNESMVKMPGKRGRNEVPQEIVEVKQDELIKNRPREDQVRLTGIAFGPSYQPVSTKGKPSKLHKRKHQIGSLFYDMKQKETELSERRARGFLTKAETQGKYGW